MFYPEGHASCAIIEAETKSAAGRRAYLGPKVRRIDEQPSLHDVHGARVHGRHGGVHAFVAAGQVILPGSIAAAHHERP